MAAKKPAPGKSQSQQGKALFARLGVAKARAMFERLFPVVTHSGAKRTTSQVGTDGFYTNCVLPGHEDDTPSLYIDCAKGYAECRGAPCGYHTTSLLKLLQDAAGWSYKDAVTQVHTATGIRVATGKAEKELEELDEHQQAVASMMEAFNDHLCRCINPPTSEDKYASDYSPAYLRAVQPTLDWLYNERGRKKKYAHLMPYGILPTVELTLKFVGKILEDRATAEMRMGVVTTTKERRARVLTIVESIMRGIDPQWIHCVTFHTGYGISTPGAIRLRKPSNDKTHGTDTVGRLHGEEDSVGFYGLYQPRLKHLTPKQIADTHVIVVEGENDANAYIEGLLESGKSGVLPLAGIGTHNNLDLLAEAGIERPHLFSDEPSMAYGKGEAWITHMLRESEKCDARVFSGWHLLKDGNPKDPDDAIRAHGFEKVYALTSGPGSQYQTVEAWALDRLNERATEVQDVRERLSHAIELGHCVKNSMAFALYLDGASKLAGVPVAALRQELVKTGFTETGYVSRLADAIMNEFHRSYREDGSRGGELYLFHRQKRHPIQFYLTDGRSMMAQMSNVYGDMWTWVKEHVGLPPALDDANLDGAPTSLLLPEKVKLLGDYMALAMQQVYQGVPSRAECNEHNQGAWWLDDPANPGTKCLYIHNGDRTYKGVWRPGCDAVLDWTELHGPSDGKELFNLDGTRRWSREIGSVADLEEGNTYTKEDLAKALRDLARMFEKLWKLKYGATDAKFLAYHLAATAVTEAFETKAIMHILGETNSGKSSLLSCFGGTQFPDLSLVEASHYRANYTAAFVSQTWNRCSLAMLLDEFEDEQNSRSHKGQQVENLSEMMRQLVTAGGTDPGRGSNDGKPRSTILHTFAALGSILRASKPQDNNRRVTIELFTNDKQGAKPPNIAMFEFFTRHEYNRIRRMFSVALHRWVPELAALQKKVGQEIAKEGLVEYAVPARFSDNLLPAVAVMALVEEEKVWKQFLKDTFTARREAIIEVAQDTASNALLERILNVPNCTYDANKRASVNQLISKADTVEFLNKSPCGVYFDERNKLLIVNWWTVNAVGGGLLYRVDGYDQMTPQNLKHTFDQHPNALKPDELKAYKVFEFLRVHATGANERGISAMRIDRVVNSLRDLPAPEEGSNVIALPQRPRVDEPKIKSDTGNV